MLGLLDSILCVLMQIPYFIVWALLTALNGIIAVLGGLASLLAYGLPSIPDAPELPAELVTVLGWIGWVWPVGTTIDILAFCAAMFLAYFVVSIALRWARVVE